MSQVLSFGITGDRSAELGEFLERWEGLGTHKLLGDNCYELADETGSMAVLTVGDREVVVEGRIPEEAFSLIHDLSAACDSNLLLEGEPIGDSTRPNVADMSTPQKIGSVALLLVLAPLIVLLLPFIALYALVRLVIGLRSAT